MDVIVANPRKVGLIQGGHTKNDSVDAEILARLARADPELLHPVEHRRENTQAALAVVRSRDTLVGARTKLINCVRGQVKAMGGRMPSCSAETFHKHTDAIPEPLADALALLMSSISELTERIRHFDRVIDDFCHHVYPETEVLLQVDGVGPVTALTFVLTIEEPGRFRSSRAVGSYLGLRPGQDQSGDKDPQRRITKAGDPMLRRLLVQCAHRMLSSRGKDSDLRRWGLALVERGGKAAKKRAVVAVARKLACLLHRLWVTGSIYEPLRNAAREIELAEAAK
jgi:transposase